MFSRVLTATIAVAVFISAYLWPHSPVHFYNAVVSAVLIFVLSVAGILGRRWRYGAAAVGAWLAGSSVFLFFMSERHLTSWSEVIFGLLVIVTAIGPLSDRHVPPNGDRKIRRDEAHPSSSASSKVIDEPI